MKKYRCPTCGQKTISLGRRISASTVYNIHPLPSHRVYESGGAFCPMCNNQFQFNRSKIPLIFNLVRPIISIAMLILSILTLNTIVIAVTAFVIVLAYPVYIIGYAVLIPILPFDKETLSVEYPSFDARLKINFSKYIKPYGVYGLKFKTETDDEKFKQAFSDGMVPAVFHPNQKGSLTYDVHIINKSAVPKELLETGSKFLVEDADGIFIAKGTIEKSELDY